VDPLYRTYIKLDRRVPKAQI